MILFHNFIQLIFLNISNFLHFPGSRCCCTSETFWVLLLVTDLRHWLMEKLLFFKVLDFVIIPYFLCFPWFAFLSWELASALKESKARFDSAGVKLIAVGVGTPNKACILAERVFSISLSVI